MIVFLLCVGIVCGTSYVGYVLALYYKKRKQFFENFVDFLNHAKTQISFIQSRRISIFESFCSNGSDFEKITKDIANGKEAKKPTYIKQEEWMVVQGFFNDLGKGDVESECQRAEATKQKAESLQKSSEKEFEKKYSLCIKIGVAVGVAVSIIIV